MVPVRMMQEILDLKAKGFSVNEIFDYLSSRGSKPPTKRTILKYYNMDSVPDNPGAALCLVNPNSTKLSCRIPQHYHDGRKVGEDSYHSFSLGFYLADHCLGSFFSTKV